MSVNIYDKVNDGLIPVAGRLSDDKVSKFNVLHTVEECQASTSALDVAGADVVKNGLGVKMFVLWENPDTSQTIGGGTQIKLNSTDYDYYEMLVLEATTNEQTMSIKAKKGCGFRFSYTYPQNGTNVVIRSRNITVVDDSTLSIGDGLEQTQGSARKTSNGHLVPQMVIGYKL